MISGVNYMRRAIKKISKLMGLFVIYKMLLDFSFLPVYYKTFSYMSGAIYEYNSTKFLISWIIFILMMLPIINIFKKQDITCILLVIIYCISIIPMLSVYAFIDYVKIHQVIYPSIFWIILIWAFQRFGNKKDKERTGIKVPAIKSASEVILLSAGLGTILCWAWSGFPILVSLSDSTAQRIALRANSMPSLMGYLFVLLGGVVVPYLFARFLNQNKKIYTIISLVLGFLLFSINGMKTWLFLYAFVFAIYLICYLYKDDYLKISYALVIVLSFLVLGCIVLYLKFQIVDFLSQLGRVLCIPNGIGFRSINFFEHNELLYLRESILRHFMETPYPGGSDFYIDCGAASTINSARSNNGLWGDAFRNFGFIGMIIYPLAIAKVLDIVRYSVKSHNLRFQIFVLFLMIWNSVNVSFFTWLLTGGVIIVILLAKFFKKEDEKSYVI